MTRARWTLTCIGLASLCAPLLGCTPTESPNLNPDTDTDVLPEEFPNSATLGLPNRWIEGEGGCNGYFPMEGHWSSAQMIRVTIPEPPLLLTELAYHGRGKQSYESPTGPQVCSPTVSVELGVRVMPLGELPPAPEFDATVVVSGPEAEFSIVSGALDPPLRIDQPVDVWLGFRRVEDDPERGTCISACEAAEGDQGMWLDPTSGEWKETSTDSSLPDVRAAIRH